MCQLLDNYHQIHHVKLYMFAHLIYSVYHVMSSVTPVLGVQFPRPLELSTNELYKNKADWQKRCGVQSWKELTFC